MTETHAFNPTERLRRVQGGALYMDVADRKLWLHTMTEHALSGAYSFTIHTEIHTLSERIAVFRAEVAIADSEGAVIRRATGWGTETPQDFGDYIEKAETKALGRALANAGFGTANAEPEGLIVDAPRGGEGGFIANGNGGGWSGNGSSGGGDRGGAPTQKQIDFYSRLCMIKGLDMDDYAISKIGHAMGELTRGEMSRLIDDLKNAPAAESVAAEPPF